MNSYKNHILPHEFSTKFSPVYPHNDRMCCQFPPAIFDARQDPEESTQELRISMDSIAGFSCGSTKKSGLWSM